MKKLLVTFILFLSALTLFFFYHPNTSVHYHAGFLVYVNGAKQDFSDLKYMDIVPCSESSHPSKVDRQLEKAHLHDGVGDVVHVEAPGATWGDLFKNIYYQFPAGLPVTGFAYGKQLPNILKQSILPDESVIIVAGSPDQINLSDYVSLGHIQQVGSQSESCSTN